MMTLLAPATVAVFVYMLLLWLPELQDPAPVLRRWSRTGGNPASFHAADAVVTAATGRFAARHALTETQTALLNGMSSRPAMVPVTLLIHPALVRFDGTRFVRGSAFNLLLAGLAGLGLIFPPTVGAALGDVPLWVFPLTDIVTFAMGWFLLKNALSDISLINLVLTGKH
ncbi:hypothetical protein NG99_03960 [Erwinia typographi]|uniref:Uncharacterized protein n=1 Tax=Erwinia typographi TaxID=371042 RepID=A0A0A4AC10_9GAMM|nr:hypothetical protein [Erwinia typographi]KGT95358.1 hypothetical protein NG99_03960 [Erwinia typographi]